jgi:DUF1009 family protein
MTSSSRSIGLVAGNGIFPLEIVKSAKEQGHKVYLVAHANETIPDITSIVDHHIWIKVGQLGKLINFFKKHKVDEVTFAGGIKRARLFREVWPDWKGAKVIASLNTRRDDEVLRAIAKELETEGIKVVSAVNYLEKSIAKVGLITKRALNASELIDAKLAWLASKELGKLDIGQASAAFEGTVIALEAIEGTDSLIQRVGSLVDVNIKKLKGHGPVLVKTCKPEQDLRLDLPTIGPDTITNLNDNGFSALVIEADKSIILDPENVRLKADSYDMAVEVVTNFNTK